MVTLCLACGIAEYIITNFFLYEKIHKPQILLFVGK